MTTVTSSRLRTIVRSVLTANAAIIASNTMGPQSRADAPMPADLH